MYGQIQHYLKSTNLHCYLHDFDKNMIRELGGIFASHTFPVFISVFQCVFICVHRLNILVLYKLVAIFLLNCHSPNVTMTSSFVNESFGTIFHNFSSLSPPSAF